MLRINWKIAPDQMTSPLSGLWVLSRQKLLALEARYDFSKGAPVITREGQYQPQGWTEWTLGFHYGSALLQFDATGEEDFLQLGRAGTADRMLHHVTHMGVHDHGFNVVSTFGNLRRLVLEKRIDSDPWERRFYELALRASAAVQARRWTALPDGGYIYSFNGPHSLFADTIRSLRSLAVGHLLGHCLLEEGDRKVSLLERLIQHARTTAQYNVYYGEGRDAFDVRGRVAHESIFNTVDGSYRCPSTHQGYSPRSTWTRGLAWIILGYAEELEFLGSLVRAGDDRVATPEIGPAMKMMVQAGRAAADFFIESSPSNGIPYWDTGAPGLEHIPNYLEQPADPFNDHEPVDSSAAAIAAQGLLRLGHFLLDSGAHHDGRLYWQAGLTVMTSLLSDPYLSRDPGHEGLLLHSIYHRPNGWDYVPEGRQSPCGESSMWGDYHLREAALYLQRVSRQEPYYTFWGAQNDGD